jgi:hypothetical protein
MDYSGMDLVNLFRKYKERHESPNMDPDWISLKTLRLWLDTCDNEHGTACNFGADSPDESHEQSLSPPASTGHPQWLIDVKKGCLVMAGPWHQYAALSYVWGQVPTLKAVKDNMTELLEKGSLAKFGELVPRTIRHTIALTKRLKISFLWVDCLCIVQDDEENLHRQLQNMASIYASAYVTIIAANGWDANHGLRGIEGVTDPRHLNDGDVSQSLQPHSSIWYSRGWTFQEMVFSRRTIMFQYQLAIWGCRSTEWHDGTTIHPKTTGRTSVDSLPLRINRFGGQLKFLPYPDPAQYISLLRDYT